MADDKPKTNTRPRVNAFLYLAGYHLILIASTFLYRPRSAGLRNIPRTGPLVIVANHQSNLDPPIVGTLLRRKYLMFIARVGLFRAAWFGKLLNAVGAIPVRRGEPDLPAIKTALARLEDGGAVVLFAEGSRTPHGRMQPFQRGASLLIKRAKCPVLPVGIDGFRDAWPRGTKVPTPLGPRIGIRVGKPIPAETLLSMKPDDALRHLGRAVDDLRLEARADLRRATRGRRPADTEGDDRTPTELWYTSEDHMPESLNDTGHTPQ